MKSKGEILWEELESTYNVCCAYYPPWTNKLWLMHNGKPNDKALVEYIPCIYKSKRIILVRKNSQLPRLARVIKKLDEQY